MITYDQASGILAKYTDDDILANMAKIENELGLENGDLNYLGGVLARRANDKLPKPLHRNRFIIVWNAPTKRDIWSYFCGLKRAGK